MSSVLAVPSRTQLSWSNFAPRFESLLAFDLSPENVHVWLKNWSDFSEELDEIGSKLYVAKTVNTADESADGNYKFYVDEIYPNLAAAQNDLKEKLLASGIEPEGFEIPLRNMRAESELFREENLPLQSEEMKLDIQYGDTVGAQTVVWEGEELTLSRLDLELHHADRSRRERAWRAGMERRIQDRATLNDLWVKLLENRIQQAKNAGYGSDYRAYKWADLQRFDYTPANCREFHLAIESAIVPLAQQIYAKRQSQLGLDSLRPWDLDVDPLGRPGLEPFATAEELDVKGGQVLAKVDPELGAYYADMQKRGLLDLGNRKNKSPGGYCTHFATQRLPFIFMNAVGSHRDVQTLLHEAGHAFHVYESAVQPYAVQLNVNTEFAEVASMGMELLCQPHLEAFYSPEDARRAQTEHLEKLVLFWPYMAVVDGFQHWVYENPEAAKDAAQCDTAWLDLWNRFMPGIDFSGLEEIAKTGWHRKLHIFEVPLYYVEYGLAQLGAVQLWQNSQKDLQNAIRQYRHALSLGGTVTLPQLFEACGCRFGFDLGTVSSAAQAIEARLKELGGL